MRSVRRLVRRIDDSLLGDVLAGGALFALAYLLFFIAGSLS